MSDELDLFQNADSYRDGRTYEAEQDHDRLAEQHKRVAAVMQDQQWHTLREIAERTGDPESSISARLRDFRKPRFGAHDVERRRIEGGLYAYRVLPGKRKERAA